MVFRGPPPPPAAGQSSWESTKFSPKSQAAMFRGVGAGVAALTFACVFSLVAINERASRSPATVLAQAGHKYVALPRYAGQTRMHRLPRHSASVDARFCCLGSFSDKQGTNRAFLAKADGSGQSTKGRVQMLASISGSGAARRAAKHAKYVALPQAGGFGTDKAFLSKGDGSGQSTKGKKQMLASILGSGAKRRQAEVGKNHNGAGYVRLPDAGSMGTNKAFVNKGDGKGMGHTSKLSGFGTDKAFLYKADGSGQSTKGKTQMLASILGSGAKRRQADAQRSHKGVAAGYVRLPDAGSMGTNKAFVNKGDGKGMGHTSKLSGLGTDKAFLNKADGSGQSTKGRKQQLYEWTAGKPLNAVYGSL
jgi:hypothetical protein